MVTIDNAANSVSCNSHVNSENNKSATPTIPADTPIHRKNVPGAGTSRMIEVLSSVYDSIPQDLAPTDRGQRQYRDLSASLEQNTELKALIQQMEAYYDAQLDAEDSPPEEPVPTTTLSPEIERFLSELGERLDSDDED